MFSAGEWRNAAVLQLSRVCHSGLSHRAQILLAPLPFLRHSSHLIFIALTKPFPRHLLHIYMISAASQPSGTNSVTHQVMSTGSLRRTKTLFVH
jgi:hypothetical protein